MTTTIDGGGALRLGTRGSRLALAQSGQVAVRLEALGHRVEIVVVRTSGDRMAEISLAKVGGKGLFLKELEEALAAGGIDLAVHSLKDVPADLAGAFAIAAIPPRVDVRDVLIVCGENPVGHPSGRGARELLARGEFEPRADGVAALMKLPHGARVGTGSLRRRAQLRALRPDLEIVAIRGNVDTRLAKVAAGEIDAIVLAAAGLQRLEVDVRASALDDTEFLPAPGQGALAFEVRADDRETVSRLAPLHDPATASACTAERAFLRALGASCQVPVAAYGRVAGGNQIELDGLVASLDGSTMLRERMAAPVERAGDLGARLAERLIARGARDVLDRAVREAGAL
jgi:hydroxymethylbilane synthase